MAPCLARDCHIANPSRPRPYTKRQLSSPSTNKPGPVRSPTDISLAQLVPNDEGGEASGSTGHQEAYHDNDPLHLHLEDATNPPPDYPPHTHSDSGQDRRRYSTDSEEKHALIRVMNRSRGNSSATATARPQHTPSGPVPSYSDAVRDGAGIQRSDSSESDSSNESSSSSS
ncbi:Protein ssh4 [Metarhizium acridum]|nr:Protein ssh4 [Metarhizium acridum]